MSAGDDSVRLTGYDYEASSTVLFPAEVDEPGELLLPGLVFAEIVHALPQGRVRVHTREGVVEISAGTSEFTLPTLPLADYPELPTPPAPVGALDAAPFTRAVAQMSRIAIRGDAVPVLSGTLLEFDGESVTLTSSDRFRVAIHQVPWKATGSDLPARAVVPARMLADATKSLGAGTDLLTVGLGGEGEAVLSLGVGERLTTLRLLDDHPALRTRPPICRHCRPGRRGVAGGVAAGVHRRRPVRRGRADDRRGRGGRGRCRGRRHQGPGTPRGVARRSMSARSPSTRRPPCSTAWRASTPSTSGWASRKASGPRCSPAARRPTPSPGRR